MGMAANRRAGICTRASNTLAAYGLIAFASGAGAAPTRAISELTPSVTLHLGGTADWVAVTPEAIWVGSTMPNAVHAIDPETNRVVVTVPLPGNPCAGLAVGFGALWVPLCAKPNVLARVDLKSHALGLVQGVGPADREGGITTSPDSVWIVSDARSTLTRIDPTTDRVRQQIRIAPGSYNPKYFAGAIWVTRADGAEATVVAADSGRVEGSVPTGPGPRFLTAGGGSVWTLNQGDGSLTRIDAQARRATATIALGTPGHGGDIDADGNVVLTTLAKVPLSVIDVATSSLRCQWIGPGGDSLAISGGSVWLTDYDRGDVSRYELEKVVAGCLAPAPK
jgi:hypothetical protein